MNPFPESVRSWRASVFVLAWFAGGTVAGAQSGSISVVAGGGVYTCCSGMAPAASVTARGEIDLASRIALSVGVGRASVGSVTQTFPGGFTVTDAGGHWLVLINGIAYFTRPTSGIRPWAEGGLTWQPPMGVNFGGGIDWVTSRKWALRFGVNDLIIPEFGHSHTVVASGGVVVRLER